MSEFYRVELWDGKDEGCSACGHGRHWTVVSGTGENESQVGTSWGDIETAEDICDLMNMAYDAGKESEQELLDALRKIAYEPFGGAEASASEVLGEITEFARAILTANNTHRSQVMSFAEVCQHGKATVEFCERCEAAGERVIDDACERCGDTGLVTIKTSSGGIECDADDQPCPECSRPAHPEVQP